MTHGFLFEVLLLKLKPSAVYLLYPIVVRKSEIGYTLCPSVHVVSVITSKIS